MPLHNFADEIIKSGKYAGVDRAVVARIWSEAAGKYPKRKDAEKAVKKELHIIFGSFLQRDSLASAESIIDGYINANPREESIIDGYKGAGLRDDRETARRLLGLHVSTAERANHLEEIYNYIGNCIGTNTCIVDIGCGFNPFALPFYATRPVGYAAYDICAKTVSLINKYFAKTCEITNDLCAPDSTRWSARAQNTPHWFACTLDAVSETPPKTPPAPGGACTLLMLKLFPLLERQRKGRAFELLGEAAFNTAIISFPTKSASGREKGMETFYTGMFERGFAEHGLSEIIRIADKAVFGNEMFYVVNRRE